MVIKLSTSKCLKLRKNARTNSKMKKTVQNSYLNHLKMFSLLESPKIEKGSNFEKRIFKSIFTFKRRQRSHCFN